MGKRIKYVIQGQIFSTRRSLEDYIRGIMNSTPLRQPLAKAQFEFMREILDQHPMAGQKIGCGVRSIEVRLAPPYNANRCCWIFREDGTEVEFSWVECLRPTSQERQFREACRTAIKEQKENFRRKAFALAGAVRCAISGEQVTEEDCHVDHEIPFENLVQLFIAQHGLNVDEVRFSGFEDGATSLSFEDKELEQEWRVFHADNAKLRITSKSANLTRKRKV